MSTTDPNPSSVPFADTIAAFRGTPLNADEATLLSDTLSVLRDRPQSGQRGAGPVTVQEIQNELEAAGPTMSPEQLQTASTLMRGLNRLVGQTARDGLPR